MAQSSKSNNRNWHGAATFTVLALGLMLAACRQPAAPMFALGQAEPGVRVGTEIKLPRKQIQQRGLLAASTSGTSTLMVNKIEGALSGPGFVGELPILGTEDSARIMPVDSDSVAAYFQPVPEGKNRFVKITAMNDSKKLHIIGGVLDVVQKLDNKINISLATTPTALVVEKLSRSVPENVSGNPALGISPFDHKRFQSWLDACVTKPQTAAGATPNSFLGHHPYCVNAQGMADYLIANNFAPPASEPWDPTSFDPVNNADHGQMVLHPGRVKVITGSVPDGTRVWINDPISSIWVAAGGSGAAGTVYFPQVAPAFEPSVVDPLSPWTVTMITPDWNGQGPKVLSKDVTIPRLTFASSTTPPAEIEVNFDELLQTAPASSTYDLTEIRITPPPVKVSAGGIPDTSLQVWDGTTLTIKGQVSRQLFAHAVNASGTIVPMSPEQLDWTVTDPTGATNRLRIGEGTVLTSPGLVGLMQDLVGININDYGMLYPMAQTDPAIATDVILVEGAWKLNPAKKDSLNVKIENFNAGQARVEVVAERVFLTTNLTPVGLLTGPPDKDGAGNPLNRLALTTLGTAGAQKIQLAEPYAPPAGTTYRWVSSHPLVKFKDPTAGPIVEVYAVAGFPGTVTITGYSSTGRHASGTVTHNFGNGAVSTFVEGQGFTAAWDNMTNTNLFPENDPATNPAVQVDPSYPAGNNIQGYLSEKDGQVYLGITDPALATDPQYPYGAYFWRSSDPTYISIEPDDKVNYGTPAASGVTDLNGGLNVHPGKYPTRRAKLKAHREGEVMIYAMDKYGRDMKTAMKLYLKRGKVSGAVTVPVNPHEINIMTAHNTAYFGVWSNSDLTQSFATGTVEALEPKDDPTTPGSVITNPAGAAFTWISHDTSRLRIEPLGASSFPTKQAKFTALRPGDVTVTLRSNRTEKVGTFTFRLTFNDPSMGNQPFSGGILRVRCLEAAPSTFGATGTVAGLNRTVTFETEDTSLAPGTDGTQPFAWTTSDPRRAQLVTSFGKQVSVRVMDYGTYTLHVVNPNTRRWGTYTLVVERNATGGATVRVTL